jgi:uncharacterized membrane protein
MTEPRRDRQASHGERYLLRLTSELRGVGIGPRARRRILDEFADHFACDPQAELGDPALVATRFADELGTSRARVAAVRAFVALAVSAGVVLARVATLMPLQQLSGQGFDTAAMLIAGLAAQVALVAGGLGVLRALRVRGRASIPAAEATVLARRAALGLLMGAVTIVCLPFAAHAAPHGHAAAWPELLASGVALLALALATPAVVGAFTCRPRAAGDAGDLFTDFGPLESPARRVAGSPTRLALAAAAALFAALALAGAVAGDGFDGIARGVAEGGALLVCYWVLGGFLGLRARVAPSQ